MHSGLSFDTYSQAPHPNSQLQLKAREHKEAAAMAALHFDENTRDPETLPTTHLDDGEELVPSYVEKMAKGEKPIWGTAPAAVAGSGYVEDGTVDLAGNPVLKAKTGGWKACPYILAMEGCERLAYYGIATNMVTYLHKQLHQNPGQSANNVTNWSGTCYITPLIGAFFADAYLGRFWTIAVFSTIYFLGMVLLTLSASIPSLKPPESAAANSAQLGVFYLSLYLIALGTGGIKPCVSSFGADQFDENDVKEKKRKSSFFNWFYFSINIGALISASALVYIQQNVGWSWGFGVPAVAMGLAICSFFIGSRRYRHQKPGGSPLTRIAQVVVAAFRKLHVKVDPSGSNLYEIHDKESGIEGSRKLDHTKNFRFLDKAATPQGSEELHSDLRPPSAWHLTSVTQVEEVKIILRLLPIWASGILFSTVYSQMSTMFVQQGALMNVYIGSFEIPAASLSIFDTLSVIVCVVLYDRVLVPVVRKRTGHVRGFTQLQRMGIGLVISVFAMVVAAVLEIKRLKLAKSAGVAGLPNDSEALPVLGISIFWQIPQYFLIGASEVFMFIGQLEFFYDQAPDAMRSMMSALSLTTVALGNYLSTVLVTIITSVTTKNGKSGWIPNNLNRGHLDYFFWTIAVLSVLNIVFYLVVSHLYTYKRVQVAAEEEEGRKTDQGVRD